MRRSIVDTSVFRCGLALLLVASQLGCRGQATPRREFVWSAPGQEIFAPRFSADGEAIALVTRAHGSPLTESEKANPRFGDPVVKVIDANGNVTCEAKYGWDPSLSPDHKRVVYSEQVKPITGMRALAATMAGNAIRMYDCETRKTRKIADPQVGYLSSPFFSADGGTIIYTNDEAVNGAFAGAIGISAFDLQRGRDTILLQKKVLPAISCVAGDSTQSRGKCALLAGLLDPTPVSFPQIVFKMSPLGNEVVALVGLPIPAVGDLYMTDRYDLSLVALFPRNRKILSLGKIKVGRDEATFQPLSRGRVLLFSQYWRSLSTSTGAQLREAGPRNANAECKYSPDLQYYLCREPLKGRDPDHFTLYRTSDAKVVVELPEMREVFESTWSPTSTRFVITGVPVDGETDKAHTEQLIVYSVR
jgi:hypothetical protein